MFMGLLHLLSFLHKFFLFFLSQSEWRINSTSIPKFEKMIQSNRPNLAMINECQCTRLVLIDYLSIFSPYGLRHARGSIP